MALKVKNLTANAGDINDVVPSLGQEDPLEEHIGTPLQYSRLENPMDRGAWQATVHGVAESRTRLNDCIIASLLMTIFPCISVIPFHTAQILLLAISQRS